MRWYLRERGGEEAMKKEDLEAIVDLLHEWCQEYGEEFARVCIVNGAGMGDVSPDSPEYGEMSVFKDYKKKDPAAATAEVQ